MYTTGANPFKYKKLLEKRIQNICETKNIIDNIISAYYHMNTVGALNTSKKRPQKRNLLSRGESDCCRCDFREIAGGSAYLTCCFIRLHRTLHRRHQ